MECVFCFCSWFSTFSTSTTIHNASVLLIRYLDEVEDSEAYVHIDKTKQSSIIFLVFKQLFPFSISHTFIFIKLHLHNKCSKRVASTKQEYLKTNSTLTITKSTTSTSKLKRKKPENSQNYTVLSDTVYQTKAKSK